MKFLILLSLLQCWANCVKSIPGNNTALAIKQAIQDYNTTMPIETTTFIELVRNSKIFIDNSLFINVSLRANDSLPPLILCPSRWGRTTILDMFKTFLELAVDENGTEIPSNESLNYKLFVKGEITLADGRVEQLQQPLLISNEKELLNQYLGKYPVIYVSFKSTIAENFQAALYKISLVVSRVYKQHEYMIKVLRKNIQIQNSTTASRRHTSVLKKFKDYLNPKKSEITEGHLHNSFTFLTQILYEHFGKKPYVLIDDYDAPIRGHLFGKCEKLDNDRIFLFIDELTRRTFRSNPYQQGGIVMGTVKISDDMWNPHTSHYIVDTTQPMREYFGFNQHQMAVLFQKHNIDEKQAIQAHKWYDGYESTTLCQHSYNPTSINNFLFYKNIANYWKENFSSLFLRNVLKMRDDLVEKVLHMISKQPVACQASIKDGITYRKDVWKVQPGTSRCYALQLFDLYLIGEGYTIEMSQSHEMKVANNEMAYLMTNWLIFYYKRRHHIDEKLLQRATDTLQDFIRKENNTTANLQQSFEMVLKNATMYINGSQNAHAQHNVSINSILTPITLYMIYRLKFEMQLHYKITKTDIVIIDHVFEKGIAIDILDDDSATKYASGSAYSHTHAFDSYDNVRTIQFIGINILPNQTVKILSQFFTKTNQSDFVHYELTNSIGFSNDTT